MNDTQPCDVFISYSRRSGSTAEKDAKDLAKAIEGEGLQAFHFEYSLTAGHVWEEEVLKQLRYCRCVLVLVPPGKSRLTDWMNHEIGIARAMKKIIIPVALGDGLRSSPPTSGMLPRYWGQPLTQFLDNLKSFISDPKIGSAAKLTALWSPYLVSGSARIVVGGYDPVKSANRQLLQKLDGGYFTIGVFRAITRLSCFFSQQFGADFLDELLIAQKTGQEEISRHDLIVIGGPNSLQNSPFEDYHKKLGIRYVDNDKAYLVGPQSHKVASDKLDGFRREACVLAFAPNPMNLDKEMLLVSGDSGYGCQGAIEYLVGTRITSEFAEAVAQWRAGSRNVPLLFEVSARFEGQSNTYVKGSGVAKPIEINHAR
jgi:hypothetical protein